MSEPTSRTVAVIVEDDPVVSELAAMLVDGLGLTAVTYPNGEDALACMEARGDDVALLFTDVRLAGSLDGVALAREVSARWPEIRVIVTSGYTREGLGPLPQRASFLQKPWRGLDVIMAGT